MKKKLISIVMVVYNQADYLNQAISSCLKQSFNKFDFFILDDASTDNTWQLLKSIKDKRLRLYRNSKRQGLAKGLNFLISKTNAQYIARMDGDDICEPERLRMQKESLDNDDNLVLVGSWGKIINANGEIVGKIQYPINKKQIRRVVLTYNPFIHSSIMFKKNIYLKIGGYNEKYFYSQDYDFYLKLIPYYKAINLKNFLIKYRFNQDYLKQKQQHLASLKIRLTAIKTYGYNKWEIIKIIKPFFLFLLPIWLKKLYWQNKFNVNN